MGTLWLGLKIGVGIALGIILTFCLLVAIRLVPELLLSLRFFRAGFERHYEGNLQGWMTRDSESDDWILWDVRNKRMLRLAPVGSFSRDGKWDWRPSGESLEQCLALGRKYRKLMGF